MLQQVLCTATLPRQSLGFFLQVTHLFRDVLHGWGQILLSVNVSPCAKDYDETAHVLKVTHFLRHETGPLHHTGNFSERKKKFSCVEMPVSFHTAHEAQVKPVASMHDHSLRCSCMGRPRPTPQMGLSANKPTFGSNMLDQHLIKV